MPFPERDEFGEAQGEATRTIEQMMAEVAEFARQLRYFLDYQETRPSSIPISGTSLSLTQFMLEEVWEGLTRDSNYLSERLEKIRSQMTHHPVDQLIGGHLLEVHSGIPKGSQPRQFAHQLRTVFFPRFEIEHPAMAVLAPEAPEATEEETLLSKLPSLLDDLALGCEAYGGEKDSTLGQLADVLCSAGGIIVSAEERSVANPSPLQGILEILEALRYEKAGDILQKWIIRGVDGEGRSGCIAALGAIVQTTFILDEASLHQKLSSPKNGGISFRPFRSLYQAVREATAYLKKLRGTDKDVAALIGIERLITVRYSQVITALPELEAGRISPPEVDRLATLFHDCFHFCRSHLETRTAAYFIAQYLKQLGATPDYTQEFCNVLGIGEFPALAQAVKKEAIITGLLPDNGNLVALEELGLFRQQPWLDAAEIPFRKPKRAKGDLIQDVDLNDVIPEGTQFVICLILSGTFGPGQSGHGDLIRKTVRYMEWQDELDRRNGRQTRRILLILPIIKPETLGKKWPKIVAEVGPVDKRVTSLLAQITDIDRSRVLISTQLQPTPSRAGSVENSILVAGNNLMTSIVQKFTKHRRLTNFRWEFLPVVGADEINFKPKGGDRLVLHHEQDPKFRQFEKWLILGRHGFLVALLENLHLMLRKMKIHPTLILTPGIPDASSSNARTILRKKPEGPIPSRILGTLFIEKWWSPQAINNRPAPVEKIPSVSTIYQAALKELEELISGGPPKKSKKLARR